MHNPLKFNTFALVVKIKVVFSAFSHGLKISTWTWGQANYTESEKVRKLEIKNFRILRVQQRRLKNILGTFSTEET